MNKSAKSAKEQRWDALYDGFGALAYKYAILTGATREDTVAITLHFLSDVLSGWGEDSPDENSKRMVREIMSRASAAIIERHEMRCAQFAAIGDAASDAVDSIIKKAAAENS